MLCGSQVSADRETGFAFWVICFLYSFVFFGFLGDFVFFGVMFYSFGYFWPCFRPFVEIMFDSFYTFGRQKQVKP